jgi:hypothetical protein
VQYPQASNVESNPQTPDAAITTTSSFASPDAMERQTSRSAKLHLESDKPYTPHDTINETSRAGLVGLASGLFIAATKNAVSRENLGALGIITRGSPIIGLSSMDSTPPLAS